MNKKFSLSTLVIRLAMIFWSVIIILPFAMLFLTSIKTNEEFYDGLWSLPANPILSSIENYSRAWKQANLGGGFLNSIFISVISLVLTLVLSSMVSYVIARRHLRHESTLSNLYLIGLLVPGMVGLTPMFLLARWLGLFNTRTILILNYTATSIPFSVFLLTAFMRTIPHELEEAAYIDGANPWQAFLRIIIPLVRSALVSAGIFAFLDFWSEYMYSLMFVTDKKIVPAAVNILQFKIGGGVHVNWGVTAAACITFIAPVILIYAIFQKQIVGGLTSGSVKG